MFLNKDSYTDKPHISQDTVQLHMGSSDLLRHGTGNGLRGGLLTGTKSSISPTIRKVAQVVPLVRSPTPNATTYQDVHIDLTSPQPELGSPDSPLLLSTELLRDGTSSVISRNSRTNGIDNLHQSVTRPTLQEEDSVELNRRVNLSRHSRDEPVTSNINNETFLVCEKSKDIGEGGSGGEVFGVIESKDLQANAGCDENRNIAFNTTFTQNTTSHDLSTGSNSSLRNRFLSTNGSDRIKTPKKRATVIIYSSTKSPVAGDSTHDMAAHSADTDTIAPGHKIRRKLARQSSSSSHGESSKTSNTSHSHDMSSPPPPKKLKTYGKKHQTSILNKTYQGQTKSFEDLSLTVNVATRTTQESAHRLRILTSPSRNATVVKESTVVTPERTPKYGRVPVVRPVEHDITSASKNFWQNTYSNQRQRISKGPEEQECPATSPISDISSASQEHSSSSSKVSASSPSHVSSASEQPVLWDESSGEAGVYIARHHTDVDPDVSIQYFFNDYIITKVQHAPILWA